MWPPSYLPRIERRGFHRYFHQYQHINYDPTPGLPLAGSVKFHITPDAFAIPMGVK